MKKALYLLLCVALLVSLFCFPAVAADEDMSAEIPTAPTDAIVNEDGSKTWYVDGVKYTEYPPIYAEFTIDFASVLEDTQVIVDAGGTHTIFSYAMYDAADMLIARYSVTITENGAYTMDCEFTYNYNNNFTAKTACDGEAFSVSFYMEEICCVEILNFQLNSDGSITEI